MDGRVEGVGVWGLDGEVSAFAVFGVYSEGFLRRVPCVAIAETGGDTRA